MALYTLASPIVPPVCFDLHSMIIKLELPKSDKAAAFEKMQNIYYVVCNNTSSDLSHLIYKLH